MKQQLGGLFSLAAKQSGVVLIGDVTAKAITFAISIIVMAYVTPEEYIIFGLFLTVMAIVVQFSDLGVNLSFVRFYSLYFADNIVRAHAHLHLAFRVKIIAFFLSSVALYFLSPTISELLGYPGLSTSLQLLAFGLSGMGVFEFLQSVYQAQQDFKKLTLLRVAEASLKLAIVGGVSLTLALSLENVFLAYIIPPTAITIVVLIAHRKRMFSAPVKQHGVGNELFSFGKWLGLSMMATMIMQHLDVLMIAPMLDHMPGESGLYYAGKKFCTPIQVLTTSLITVFYPKAMAITSVGEMKQYVQRTLRVSIPISLVLVLYLAALYVFLPEFLPQYADALPVISILFIGWIWTLIGNPITILMLSMNRANIATRISFAQLIVMIGSHYYFITNMGGIGAALSNILVWFAAGVISFWYIYRHRHVIEQVREVSVD